MLTATHQPSPVVSRPLTIPETCLICSYWTKPCEICPAHDLPFPSDTFRKNAFQVIAVDGVCSGVIQFPTAEDCLDWLQAIAGNISSLTKHNVSMTQSHLSVFANSRGPPSARQAVQTRSILAGVPKQQNFQLVKSLAPTISRHIVMSSRTVSKGLRSRQQLHCTFSGA